MAKINKVTRMYPEQGAPISDPAIQQHFDAMNAEGWELIGQDSLGGWYRFFWAKDVE